MKLNQKGAFDLTLVAALIITVAVGGFVLARISDTGSDAALNTSVATDSLEETTDQDEASIEDRDSNQNEIIVEDTESPEEAEIVEVPAPEMVPVPNSCTDNNGLFDEVEWAPQHYGVLTDSILGEWIGCVYTPWNPGAIRIAITFNKDGTYSVRNLGDSTNTAPALYYGTNSDSELKEFSIIDVQDSGLASGEIKISGNSSFNQTTSNFFDLRLDGNRLEFSFLHRNTNGPLQLLLVRADQ